MLSSAKELSAEAVTADVDDIVVKMITKLVIDENSILGYRLHGERKTKGDQAVARKEFMDD